MPKTRKGGRKSHKRGGSAVGGLMAAIKKALPSYLLYQAVKMQQRKKKRGGSSCGTKKKHKKKRGGMGCGGKVKTHKKKHKHKKRRGGSNCSGTHMSGGRTRRRR